MSILLSSEPDPEIAQAHGTAHARGEWAEGGGGGTQGGQTNHGLK